jgi:hypothetical protein
MFKIKIKIFEKSQGEHNNLDCQISFRNRLHSLQSFNNECLTQFANVSIILLHV